MNPAQILQRAQASLPCGPHHRRALDTARGPLLEILPKGTEHRLHQYLAVLRSYNLQLLVRAFAMGQEHALTPATPLDAAGHYTCGRCHDTANILLAEGEGWTCRCGATTIPGHS